MSGRVASSRHIVIILKQLNQAWPLDSGKPADGARIVDIVDVSAEMYGRGYMAVDENTQSIQSHAPDHGRRFYLAVLIGAFVDVNIRRRNFFSIAVKRNRFCAGIGSLWKQRSGTPCSLPRSSTGYESCIKAAPEPSRRTWLSDLWGNITGSPAWSA